ncbi:MAG: hypothetical protein CL610_00740 [Anaerolineaceae bacterium]|nr:hypothetical protein [Anaerolineaceae bacterium]
MNLLKKIFGGDTSGVERDNRAVYFYVQPLRCDDVLRVRVDLHNDLSLRDDGDGYWVRKLISSGNYKCNQVELTLYFDSNRRLQQDMTEIQGGKIVDREAFDAWQAQTTAE